MGPQGEKRWPLGCQRDKESSWGTNDEISRLSSLEMPAVNEFSEKKTLFLQKQLAEFCHAMKD